MSRQLVVNLNRRGDHPSTRQRVVGSILINTGDDHLDARIWHLWHHAHVQVSELLGMPKRVGVDVGQRSKWYVRPKISPPTVRLRVNLLLPRCWIVWKHPTPGEA